jgi:hypothetical protein
MSSTAVEVELPNQPLHGSSNPVPLRRDKKKVLIALTAAAATIIGLPLFVFALLSAFLLCVFYRSPLLLTPLLCAVVILVVWLVRSPPSSPSSPSASPPSRKTLLVISMDGFRASYMQSRSQNLTNIKSFFREGVKSKGLRPSFPSLTFPNHYTLATGLYPSVHGIVANNFINPDTAEQFSMGSGGRQPRWWGGEPIWVTARKAALNAYVYFWPGSEVELQGYRPTEYRLCVRLCDCERVS